nr:unnamed protein product [Spirometra erinaceieuropaei]
MKTSDDLELSEDGEKAEHLSQFFKSIFTKEREFLPPDCDIVDVPTIEYVSFAETIVCKEQLKLNKSKSPVLNDIPPNLLKLETTTNLRGHTLKLRVTGAKLDIQKFIFSNGVIEAWNALPTDVVMSTSVEACKRKLDQRTTKRHNAT